MPPADVFKETADAIPLSDISEFRCGRKANVLEISQRNKKPVFSLDTERDPVVRSIYESLRAKLAPNEQPAEGCLGTGSSTANPVVGLFFSVIVGVVLIWIAASTDEADLERIAGKGLVDALLDRPLAVLGLTGAVVITLVCLTVSTVWLIYRIKHPLPAFVVTIAATAKPEH
jgi:hypothetical protein